MVGSGNDNLPPFSRNIEEISRRFVHSLTMLFDFLLYYIYTVSFIFLLLFCRTSIVFVCPSQSWREIYFCVQEAEEVDNMKKWEYDGN